jgi:hypothetical protein
MYHKAPIMIRRLLSTALTRLPLCPVWPEFAGLEGIRVPIRHSPFPPRLRRHLMRGGYETDERRLVQQFVKSGDEVLEVGASSGVVTSFLWRQVGPEGRVVSVDGNGALKPFFDEVLKANGFSGNWVEAIAYPVWTEKAPEAFGASGFSPSQNPLGGAISSRESVPAEVVGKGPGVMTLRQIAEKTGLRPTVLVADIEGTEGVWCGAPPALPESVKAVILEIHPQLIGVAAAGATVQALIDEGFRVSGISGLVFALSRP